MVVPALGVLLGLFIGVALAPTDATPGVPVAANPVEPARGDGRVRGAQPDRGHTRALAIVLAGSTLALIVGVPAGAFIGDALDWRATLWAIGLLCLPAIAAVLVGTLTRPAMPGGTGGAGTIGRELTCLRSRAVQVNLVLAVLVNAATFCTFTYLAVIATGPADLTELAVPLLLALSGAGAFLGVHIAGRLGDNHWRRLITCTGPLLMAGWVLLASTTTSPAGCGSLSCPRARCHSRSTAR